MWVNASGRKSWVKYHFKTGQGVHNFTDAEAKAMIAQGGRWLDVRLPSEHQNLAIEGSLNIPLYFIRLKISTLDRASNAARALQSGIDPNTVPNYLLSVDNPLVVPAGVKVRLLITAQDVIHSWWVPAVAIKKDAIPGFVNEAWFKIDADKRGLYRGQCAELCGRDHGFMPIVIDVRSKADFDQWIKSQQTANQPAPVVTPAPATG